MIDASPPSDERILRQLGERLARLRLERDLTQATLAEEAGVSKRTVERIEAGHSIQFSSLIRVLRALGLGARLDLLVPPPIASPIERLEHQGKRRRRASSARAESGPKEPWSWGEES